MNYSACVCSCESYKFFVENGECVPTYMLRKVTESIVVALEVIVTPRAHARSGVKQSVLSVSRLSVSQSVSQSSVRRKILKSSHIDPHKPSKWSQTIANSQKQLYVYLTEVKALRFTVFWLFPTFHNYS